MGNESDQKRAAAGGAPDDSDPAGPVPGKSSSSQLKLSIDIFEPKFESSWKPWYFKVTPTLKVKGSLELLDSARDPNGKPTTAPSTVGPSGSTTGGIGIKRELKLGEQEFRRQIFGVDLEGKLKEKLSFTLTNEKLDASVDLEGRAHWAKLPWLNGAADVSFKFVSVKWADLRKDPSKVKGVAVEGGIGFSGEGPIDVPNLGPVQASITGLIGASVSPNWEKIGAKVAEKVAERGAQTAATTGTTAAGTAGTGAVTGTAGGGAAAAAAPAIAIDAAAVAGSAAAVIAPLAAAAVMIAGVLQTEKNVRASRAASAMGTKMRDEMRAYVRAYVTTLAGGSASGQGELDANVKVMQQMAATHQSREDACRDLLAAAGGRDGLTTKLLGQLRQQLFDRGVATYEDKFADDFGVIEKIGPNWGMRGVFRRDLRGFLYEDG